MQVERREWLAARNDLRDAAQTGKDARKRRRHLEDDAGAASRNQVGVAAELQCVTETLLAVQQNGAPVKRAVAEPERLREIAALIL